MLGSSSRSVLVSGTAFAALMCAAAMPAQAQSTQPEQETTGEAATPTGAEKPKQPADLTTATEVEEQSQEIIVTGSRIRRDPNESALPLQIVTNEEMQRNAISSPEQLIGYLTTNGTGADNLASNTDVTTGQQRGVNGASFANLRGQGSGATLVLLNGRRIAAHGLQGSAVDVNQIPFAAIERVEVLKEGASAIYGTDAIGGVLNFILRKDYEGLGIQGFTDVAEEGDHTIYRTSAIAGYGDLDTNGFNVMGAVSFSDIPALRADQRDFVNTFQPNRGLSVDTRGTPHATIFARSGTFFPDSNSFPFIPGTTTRASGGINVLDLPGGEGCDAFADMAPYDPQLWNIPGAEYACAWDTGRAALLQQPLETLTWLGRGVVALGNHEIAAEITGSDATAIKRFSNLQLFPGSILYPSTGRNYDEIVDRLVAVFPELEARRGLPISARWRCMECGRREIITDTKTQRLALGVDGPIFGGWDYWAGASHAQSESQSELGSGYYYVGGLIGAMSTGIIDPFLLPGQTQSQEALDLLESTSARGVVLYGGKYSVFQVDGSVSGGLFELPGGTVRAALGVDYRKEKYRFNGDAREAADRPSIFAAPFDDSNALDGVNRNIKAAYGELLLPVIDNLEITAAARIDDYSDFGSTVNPLVAFKFRPIRPLMFRGNYNTGFRAPAFNQVYNGRLESLYTGADLADPQSCPGGVPNATVPGCEVLERQVDIITGGNPDLGPETAKMASLGVVFEPAQNFSASLDWWTIKRQNNIHLFTLRELVSNYSLLQDRFIRDSSGRLVQIDRTWVNAGASKTQGLEVVLRGALDALGGNIRAGLDGTYLLQKKDKVLDGLDYGPSQVGVFSFAGDLGLRWKHNAFVSYDQGSWTLALTQIFRSGYENQELPGVTSGLVNPPDLEKDVDRYVIYNLSAGVEVTERMRLTAGIKNLFDTDPPFAITYDSNTGGGSSWEPRVADPRGRALTMNVDVKF